MEHSPQNPRTRGKSHHHHHHHEVPQAVAAAKVKMISSVNRRLHGPATNGDGCAVVMECFLKDLSLGTRGTGEEVTPVSG